MSIFLAKEQIHYDGHQLKPHFIAKYVLEHDDHFEIEKKSLEPFGDAVFCFIGSMDVRPDQHMVDLEDVVADDGIYSDLALQFIVEHFNSDLELAIYRQRLFISCIAKELKLRGIDVTQSGDDLLVGGNKLSVSIATASNVSTLIHIGLNILPVPLGKIKVNAISLKELGLVSTGTQDLLYHSTGTFGLMCAQYYVNELASIKKARSKVISV